MSLTFNPILGDAIALMLQCINEYDIKKIENISKKSATYINIVGFDNPTCVSLLTQLKSLITVAVQITISDDIADDVIVLYW